MGTYNILKGLTNPAGVLWEGNRRLRTNRKNRARIKTIQIELENRDLLIPIQPCHHLRVFFPLVSCPPGVLEYVEGKEGMQRARRVREGYVEGKEGMQRAKRVCRGQGGHAEGKEGM
jgi:hypothetical protein